MQRQQRRPNNSISCTRLVARIRSESGILACPTSAVSLALLFLHVRDAHTNNASTSHVAVATFSLANQTERMKSVLFARVPVFGNAAVCMVGAYTVAIIVVITFTSRNSSLTLHSQKSIETFAHIAGMFRLQLDCLLLTRSIQSLRPGHIGLATFIPSAFVPFSC